jgi:hypothetical protein
MPASAAAKDVADFHRLIGPENLIRQIKKHSVLVKEPLAEQIHLGPILRDISDLLERYIVFSSAKEPSVIALWIAHTWVLDAFDYTPYLNIRSPEKQCGKSKLLDCLSLLVAKPLPAVSASQAALFRIIEQKRPTILLDEVDTIFSGKKKDDNSEMLRALLNTGFERKAKILRCDGNNFVPKEFSVFCAKALVGIGTLPETVNDRCIPILLMRKARDEQVERFRKRAAEVVADPLRLRLEKWAGLAENLELLRAAEPEMPNELTDRQWDISEPIVAIADLAGGDWPKDARDALVGLFQEGADSADSYGCRLLTDIREVFNESDTERLSTKELLESLVDKESSQWGAWWGKSVSDGKMQTPASELAKILKRYGIKPEVIKQTDGTTARGYLRAQFAESWTRYCPPPPSET